MLIQLFYRLISRKLAALGMGCVTFLIAANIGTPETVLLALAGGVAGAIPLCIHAQGGVDKEQAKGDQNAST